MGVTVCSERSSCPCLCSGVVRLAHGKCEVMARYHVQTAYSRFKVRYEESRAQCGHYVRLLSSTRTTLWGCAVNNQKNFGRLNNYIRFYLWKRKIPPTQRSDGFCRGNGRQNEAGGLRGGIGAPHSVLNKRKCERRQWRHSHKRLLFLISMILDVN